MLISCCLKFRLIVFQSSKDCCCVKLLRSSQPKFLFNVSKATKLFTYVRVRLLETEQKQHKFLLRRWSFHRVLIGCLFACRSKIFMRWGFYLESENEHEHQNENENENERERCVFIVRKQRWCRQHKIINMFGQEGRKFVQRTHSKNSAPVESTGKIHSGTHFFLDTHRCLVDPLLIGLWTLIVVANESMILNRFRWLVWVIWVCVMWQWVCVWMWQRVCHRWRSLFVFECDVTCVICECE